MEKSAKRPENTRSTSTIPRRQESPKRSGYSRIYCQTEENENSRKDLQEYLAEASIHPTIQEESGPQIEVIEKNLRHIQEKSLFVPNIQRHVRYPSFGTGGVEKEQKISVRRVISDEAPSQIYIERIKQQQQQQLLHQQQEYQQQEQQQQQRQQLHQSYQHQRKLECQQSQQQFQQHQQYHQNVQEHRSQSHQGCQTQTQYQHQQQQQPAQKPASPRTKMPHEISERNTKTEKEGSNSLNKVPSSKKIPTEIETNPPKHTQLSYNSLMNSLNLRKNLSPQRLDSSFSNQGTLPLTLDSSLDPLDQIPQSIYSGCLSSNLTPSKRVVDIYERNNQWLSTKQSKIQTLNTIKSTQEMRECTFKPVKVYNDKSDSISSQKSFNSYGLARNSVGISNSPTLKRSISKEKKILNSYNGFHKLRKEVGGSSSNDISISPKGSLYSTAMTVTQGSFYIRADQR